MNKDKINNINIAAKNIQSILKDSTCPTEEKKQLIKLAAQKILIEIKS